MYVIGIAGGSGAGKSTLAAMIQVALGQRLCHILGQDRYYKNVTSPLNLSSSLNADFNFDQPRAVDFHLLRRHIQQLRKGQATPVPVYDFCKHRRLKRVQIFKPKSVLIVEGSMILSQASLRRVLDLSIYIKASKKLRLDRRSQRDVNERGRSIASVQQQFRNFTQPMHKKHVEPFAQKADMRIQATLQDFIYTTLFIAT